jgi:hypothetical protein
MDFSSLAFRAFWVGGGPLCIPRSVFGRVFYDEFPLTMCPHVSLERQMLSFIDEISLMLISAGNADRQHRTSGPAVPCLALAFAFRMTGGKEDGNHRTEEILCLTYILPSFPALPLSFLLVWTLAFGDSSRRLSAYQQNTVCFYIPFAIRPDLQRSSEQDLLLVLDRVHPSPSYWSIGVLDAQLGRNQTRPVDMPAGTGGRQKKLQRVIKGGTNRSPNAKHANCHYFRGLIFLDWTLEVQRI